MRRIIISAIQNKQLIELTYDGLRRVVEPHAIGVSKAGNDVMRCFQTAGGHVNPGHDWDLMILSKITGLSATGHNFTDARPGYKRGDSGMTTIFAEL
jgi:hypothetical protein